MDFHVGQTFGDYSITALLGAGGMERVYKVEHRLTQRTEAMKVLAAELATETQIQRFEREMRVLARLSHPNIAVLHNAVHSEKQLILFMEFIDGRTLESALSAGRLPIDEGVGYVKQILAALRYAHQKGVVHRDVTPAKVIVTAGGEVKLTDFGLSKSFGDPLLTNCGEILGALPYLAPERLKGVTQPDRRSDLFSVGAILYELLTGQKPFGAARRLAPVITDSEAEPQPPTQLQPSLSPQWDEIIRRALARNPAHRYQSAEEFLDSIVQLDLASRSDLPLKHWSKLTIGIAVLAIASVVLAFSASPAFSRLRTVPPSPALSHRLHIPPPDFASSIAPPPLAKPKEVSPSKRIVHLARARVAEPHPAAETSNNGPTAPIAIPVQDAKEPSATESADSGASEARARMKRPFWSKLNVFKKNRSIDPNKNQ
jgi:serine/threonine-protein kinase